MADVRAHGPGYLDRFSAKRRGTLWYYRSLVEIYRERGRDVTELERVVEALEEILGDRIKGDCPDL